MNRLFPFVLVGLLALCMLSGPVLAQESERVVVVVDVSTDTAAHAQVAHDVRRALHKHAGYRLAEIHSALNAGDEVEAQNNIRTAQGFHDAGQRAFEEGDVEDAAEHLESAARLMEKSFAALGDITEYRALLLRLGEARRASGDEEGAARAFERAVIFRARGWEAPLGPDATEALERARSVVAERPTGAVFIETDPEHAEVWIDGRYAGISPVTATGLTVGEHVVTVAKAGFARKTAALRADGEELTAVELTLDRARRARLYDQLVARLRAEIERTSGPKTQNVASTKAMASLLLGEVGVIVSTTGEDERARVDLYVFDTLARRLLSRAHRTLDITKRSRESMATLVGELLDIDYGVALGGTPLEPADTYRRPITSRWWFWTVITAGTLGGVTAAILMNQEEPTPDPTTGSMILRF